MGFSRQWLNFSCHISSHPVILSLSSIVIHLVGFLLWHCTEQFIAKHYLLLPLGEIPPVSSVLWLMWSCFVVSVHPWVVSLHLLRSTAVVLVPFPLHWVESLWSCVSFSQLFVADIVSQSRVTRLPVFMPVGQVRCQRLWSSVPVWVCMESVPEVLSLRLGCEMSLLIDKWKMASICVKTHCNL